MINSPFQFYAKQKTPRRSDEENKKSKPLAYLSASLQDLAPCMQMKHTGCRVS
jgi:hypothetical protein